MLYGLFVWVKSFGVIWLMCLFVYCVDRRIVMSNVYGFLWFKKIGIFG